MLTWLAGCSVEMVLTYSCLEYVRGQWHNAIARFRRDLDRVSYLPLLALSMGNALLQW